MKKLIVLLAFLPALALAQPSGSGSSAEPAPAADPPPAPPPTPEPKSEARKACTDAMNADPTFAAAIVEVADKAAAEKRLELDLAQHETAAKAIAKNQKHVILAYAAMWVIAAAFVIFLWRRQQALRGEIAQLKADLDAATKDGA